MFVIYDNFGALILLEQMKLILLAVIAILFVIKAQQMIYLFIYYDAKKRGKRYRICVSHFYVFVKKCGMQCQLFS